MQWLANMDAISHQRDEIKCVARVDRHASSWRGRLATNRRLTALLLVRA